MIKLFNPTDNDILDFIIEEPRLVDEEGNIVLEQKTEKNWEKPASGIPINSQNLLYPSVPVNQKKANKWSIKAKETKEFPNYVANYLKKVYPFLEVK